MATGFRKIAADLPAEEPVKKSSSAGRVFQTRQCRRVQKDPPYAISEATVDYFKMGMLSAGLGIGRDVRYAWM